MCADQVSGETGTGWKPGWDLPKPKARCQSGPASPMRGTRALPCLPGELRCSPVIRDQAASSVRNGELGCYGNPFSGSCHSWGWEGERGTGRDQETEIGKEKPKETKRDTERLRENQRNRREKDERETDGGRGRERMRERQRETEMKTCRAPSPIPDPHWKPG